MLNGAVPYVPEGFDWPEWIQAVGVILALAFTGYQFRRDGKDRAAEAKRQEQAAFDEQVRHRVAIEERRRERLIELYAKLVHGVSGYLTNMAMHAELEPVAEAAAAQAEKSKTQDSKAAALKIGEAMIQHHAQARVDMAVAVAAHVAMRFDETGPALKEVDDLVQRVQEWRGGDPSRLLVAVHEFVTRRSDEMRPKVGSDASAGGARR